MAVKEKRPVKRPASKKKAAKKTAPVLKRGPDGQRLVKPPKRRPWRRTPKRFRRRPKLANAWKISWRALKLMLKNWKVVGGIVLVYGVLSILLVRGLNGGADISSVKHQLDTFFHGALGHLATGVSVFGLLLTSSESSNTASNTAGAYQMFLFVIVSLAVVWTYRQLLAGKKVRIRDGFYQGMFPFVTVLLVLIVVALETLPLLAGGWVYGVVIANGIATTGLEQLLFLAIFLVLALVSFYMFCSSLFALYIVTLPGMTPMKALRSARGLVLFRRWSVLRKLVFLPILLIILGLLIMLPFIWFVPVLAQWVFFVLTMLALAAIHAYMYILYRELLND